jgi:DNA-binding NarL/FixJ family response regulator
MKKRSTDEQVVRILCEAESNVVRKVILSHFAQSKSASPFSTVRLFRAKAAMFQKEQWMQIHVLKAPGLSLREIARRLGVSRNTVTR